MSAFNIADIRRRMEGALASLTQEFSGLRTGRASTGLVDHLQVEVYGSMMPLKQVASISTPESRMITVQVWDQSQVKSVEKAIANAGLGLNPQTEGNVIRLPLPELSEERRKELVKVAHKYAEDAKISVRNVRRDGMDTLKKLEKDGKITEDDHRRSGEEVQKATDEVVKKVDALLASKEKEILHV
ncbi:MAG: ribosome recycling factor [Alphaproteobacteria bacterium]|nr:ribosome recycling factor [Alphaproteobacteria bacterium]